MNKEPETYQELIRYKRCIDLLSYYPLTQEELDKIYRFLETYVDAVIIGNSDSLTLTVRNHPEIPSEIINTVLSQSNIASISVGNNYFTVIPKFTSYSGSGYSSSYSSGGRSSNNNNNNNNNNR